MAYVIDSAYVIEVNAVIWFWCKMSGCLNKGFAEGLFLKRKYLKFYKKTVHNINKTVTHPLIELGAFPALPFLVRHGFLLPS